MKKITLCLMAIGLSLTINPLHTNAATTLASSSSAVSKHVESAKTEALLLRLNEIYAMDKKNLNSADKKHLRSEVLSIKHQLQPIGGGIYISAGALIIIVLLLIILL